MSPSTPLEALKAELEAFGQQQDAAATVRSERMLNITRDTGAFLGVLVSASNAHDILEIGTSNGYSTLWLGEAAMSTGGQVVTVEHLATKAALARQTFSRAGFGECVVLIEGEAEAALAARADASVDLLFLDADRSRYLDWWPDLRRVLRPGGLLVVDNAVSHRDALAAFIHCVARDGAFRTSLAPVGKGEFLAVRERQAPG